MTSDGITLDNYTERLREFSCPMCARSGAFFQTFRNSNNNGVGLVCPCGRQHPASKLGIYWLRQGEHGQRPKSHERLADTWARGGERCWHCGAPRDWLEAHGVGRHQHHAHPYVEEGHVGPLIPLCATCHEHASAQYRLMRRLVEAWRASRADHS